MIIKARSISQGKAEGYALVSKMPISFYGEVDKKTGIIINKKSDIYMESLKNKVLIFPYSIGSTVGSWIIYALKKNSVAPAAIIVDKADMILASGCLISEIPLLDKPEKDLKNIVKKGDYIKIDGDLIILD
jgi:predicted aconitase with swiveling domain